jgi:hypothetical protein
MLHIVTGVQSSTLVPPPWDLLEDLEDLVVVGYQGALAQVEMVVEKPVQIVIAVF